jgi:hypothetical protein
MQGSTTTRIHSLFINLLTKDRIRIAFRDAIPNINQENLIFNRNEKTTNLIWAKQAAQPMKRQPLAIG